jgi:60 kDa SS-A/Ro ribonucleoprotein
MSKKNSIYTNAINTKKNLNLPVTEKIVDSNQKPNNGGGFSFVVDNFVRLERFLVLGSCEPTYYTDETKLTKQNVNNVLEAIKQDGVRVVNIVAQISESGRAPKNDSALLVLALVMKHGNSEAQNAAVQNFSRVARIGTHVLTFAGFVAAQEGWSGKNPPARRAVTKWLNEQTGKELAFQFTKYANRNGWTNADVLRLAHVKPASPTHDALFAYAVGKPKESFLDSAVDAYMGAVAEIKQTKDPKAAIKLISDHRLPREVLPTELLNSPLVWDALLSHMGIGALARSLAKMTNVGLLDAYSAASKLVVDKLHNVDAVKKSRIHPIQLLSALLTYKNGRGARGNLAWTPVQKIITALDDAFYTSFGNVEKVNRRVMIGVDVSGSMTMGELAGVPGLSPNIAAACFALVLLHAAEDTLVMGFGSHLQELPLHARMRLDEAAAKAQMWNFGGTNPSLLFSHAANNKLPVEAFYVLTDNEVNSGNHPANALRAYRKQSNINAKMVVAGFTASEFSIARCE